MILIRKRPDGFFERVASDGRVDLFRLADDDDQSEAAAPCSMLMLDEASAAPRRHSGD